MLDLRVTLSDIVITEVLNSPYEINKNITKLDNNSGRQVRKNLTERFFLFS